MKPGKMFVIFYTTCPDHRYDMGRSRVKNWIINYLYWLRIRKWDV